MLSNKLNIISDRYQIKQKLSHKAGRQTLLATDTQSQELVIIKILQFDSLFQWDDLKLFEREAKTLKNIDHPAIPKYLDYFEIDNEQIQGFALVQTYIDAPSLRETIEQGRKFSEVELIELAEKMLSILTYLHQHNPPIIHRDLKPSNILITNRTGNSIGELYLVDFGSVQTAASKEEGTITIVGTYGYIPLEQFGGNTVPASDLYSLGMTLIYLITGVHPAELTQVNGRVEFNTSDISSKFSRWLAKMTNPYLDKRFNSTKSAQAYLKSAPAALQEEHENSVDFVNLKSHHRNLQLYRGRYRLHISYHEVREYYATLCTIIVIILPIFFVYFFIYFGGVAAVFWGLFYQLIAMFTLGKYIPIRTSFTNIYIYKIGIITGQPCDKKSTGFQWPSFFDFHSKNKYIVYNSGYSYNSEQYFTNKGQKIKESDVVVAAKPKLSIYVGHREYIIDNNSKFTPAELRRLGQEISNFLDLELRVI